MSCRSRGQLAWRSLHLQHAAPLEAPPAEAPFGSNQAALDSPCGNTTVCGISSWPCDPCGWALLRFPGKRISKENRALQKRHSKRSGQRLRTTRGWQTRLGICPGNDMPMPALRASFGLSQASYGTGPPKAPEVERCRASLGVKPVQDHSSTPRIRLRFKSAVMSRGLASYKLNCKTTAIGRCTSCSKGRVWFQNETGRQEADERGDKRGDRKESNGDTKGDSTSHSPGKRLQKMPGVQ